MFKADDRNFYKKITIMKQNAWQITTFFSTIYDSYNFGKYIYNNQIKKFTSYSYYPTNPLGSLENESLADFVNFSAREKIELTWLGIERDELKDYVIYDHNKIFICSSDSEETIRLLNYNSEKNDFENVNNIHRLYFDLQSQILRCCVIKKWENYYIFKIWV